MTDEQWLREGLAGAVPEPPQVPDRAAAARERAAQARRRTATALAVGTAAVVAAIAVGATAFDNEPDAPPAGGPTEAVEPLGPYDAPPCPPAPRPSSEPEPPDAPDTDAPGSVPAGATSARLCAGVGHAFDVPDDALVTGVSDLVRAVNALPQAPEPPSCNLDLGIGYRLAFGYPDGSQFVTSGALYGCHTIVVGSSTRADSDEPWRAFVEDLSEQREALESPGPEGAPAVDCSRLPTSPVARAGDITEAALCIGKRALPIPISARDLAVLLEDIRARSGSHPGFACRATPTRIVGTTSWGDRVALYSECATMSYELPNANPTTTYWTPSDEAQAILDGLLSAAVAR